MNNKVIVVIGMHRSGSSVLSKALSCSGVKMGDVFVSADEFNPRGYWEDEEIVQLNDRIMSSFGCDWNSLGLLFNSTELMEINEELRSEAVELIKRKKELNTLWGFKDPRASRLVPFWNDIFKELEITPLYVISLRSPSSVYQSLKKRNSFSKEKSTLLWLEHTLASIRDTEGCDRLIVHNKKLIESPEFEIERIISFIGSKALSESVLSEFVDGFLDASLNHYDNENLSAHASTLDSIAFDVYMSLNRCNDFKKISENLESVYASKLFKERLLFEIVKERNLQKLMYAFLENSIEEKDLYADSLIQEVKKHKDHAEELKDGICEIKEYPDSLLISLNISREYALSLENDLRKIKIQMDSINNSLLKKETYIESLEVTLNRKDEYVELLLEQNSEAVKQVSLVHSDLNTSKEYVKDLNQNILEKDRYIRILIKDNNVITDYINNLKKIEND